MAAMTSSILALVACTGGDANRFQAYLGDESGNYRVAARTIPTLHDPERMRGALGKAYAGGVLRFDLTSYEVSYEEGRDLQVQYVVEGGVAKPLDRDGLILFSFFGSLQDASDTLTTAGVDISALFPVWIGVTPAVPSPDLAFFPVDNAAYAPTANAFILLDDLDDREVPLAANAGVVTHELGHGVFHLLTGANDPYAPKAFDVLGEAANGVSSLDEGFADMLASLITGDPDFISASLDMPERDVSGDQTSAGVPVDFNVPLPENAADATFYDPYPLGSVFAAVVWDIYEATGDRDATLVLITDAVREWAAREVPSQSALTPDEQRLTVYRWLSVLVELGDADQAAAACESIGWRFADHIDLEICP